jgi:serine/threonine-protein phosphatase 4 regulatory subunit 1
MVDVNTQNSLDSEMNYNCAYNFPAIALTLGAKNWKYIKNLYKKLAEDVSWKVRQTLAYSIHELAIILGQEYTQTDLVPIFDSYIKDVDEVRIGIVANLTKFLKVLNVDYRRSYMPKLNDFLKMDNQRNWRFRNELGLYIFLLIFFQILKIYLVTYYLNLKTNY